MFQWFCNLYFLLFSKIVAEYLKYRKKTLLCFIAGKKLLKRGILPVAGVQLLQQLRHVLLQCQKVGWVKSICRPKSPMVTLIMMTIFRQKIVFSKNDCIFYTVPVRKIEDRHKFLLKIIYFQKRKKVHTFYSS